MRQICFLLLCILIACTNTEKPLKIVPSASPSGVNAAEPYLFTGPSGDVFLSWVESADTVHVLKYSRWEEEGGKWTDPVTIASGNNWFVNWADYPMMVSDGRGNMLAAFLQKSSEAEFSYDVKITSSADGQQWSEPVTLHDDGKPAEHGFVSLIPFAGQVWVSWLDGRNTVSDETARHDSHGHQGVMTLRAAMLNDAGEKIQDWELDNRVCDCCQTTTASTINGPVVIYRDRSENEVRDISIVRWVNNAWTEPTAVYPDNWKINGCPVNGPRCKAIENTLAIAWFTMANDKPTVKVAFSSDGGKTFGQPVEVNEKQTMGRVDLVLLDKNTALVSWMEGQEIKVRRIFKNGTKGRPTTIALSSEARASGFPQLTKCRNGVMIAWTDAETKTIKTASLQL